MQGWIFQIQVLFWLRWWFFNFLKMNILKNLNLQAVSSCFVKYFNDVLLLHIHKSSEWTRSWEGQTTYCKFEMGDTHTKPLWPRPSRWRIPGVVPSRGFPAQVTDGLLWVFSWCIFGRKPPGFFPPKLEPTGRTSYRSKVRKKGLVSREFLKKLTTK